MQKQKGAVVATVLAMLAEYDIEFTPFQEAPLAKELLDDKMKAEVRAILFEGFRNDEIVLSEKAKVKYKTDAALKVYVSGLLNNHLRKAKELNGNVQWVADKPGSRAGSGDETVREMKKMLKGFDPTSEEYRLIQVEIDKRIALIKPAKSVVINADVIPEHLKHLLQTPAETEVDYIPETLADEE